MSRDVERTLATLAVIVVGLASLALPPVPGTTIALVLFLAYHWVYPDEDGPSGPCAPGAA